MDTGLLAPVTPSSHGGHDLKASRKAAAMPSVCFWTTSFSPECDDDPGETLVRRVQHQYNGTVTLRT